MNKPVRVRKADDASEKLSTKRYAKLLRELQVELCHLQDWVREAGERVIIVFEGRDTAGKGGIIKAITERVSPRTYRVVALSAPTEREKTQLYLQRYVEHFPAAGEIVIFDRSWYNRAGVERVMGFTPEPVCRAFLEHIPEFEKWLCVAGIRLIKIWLEVGMKEQDRRIQQRVDDPLRQWKLSPMDLKSYSRWYDYSRARDDMFEATDTEFAPWFILRTDDKKRGRLNGISKILSLIPYERIEREKVKLPKRSSKKKYDDRLDFTRLKLIPERY